MSEMSWMVPEVRVGDISLPEIRQCDVDDDGACTASDADPRLEHDDEPPAGSPVASQPKWFVMDAGDAGQPGDAEPDAARLLGIEMRGNLPREGALPLSAASPQSAQSGLGASLLAVPWQAPRRRHSWICR